MSRSTRRPVLRVGLVTLTVLLIPLMWMQFSEEVDWTLFDFVLAAVLLAGAGTLIELAVKRPRSAGLRVAAAAVGIAAMALGEADDAPGLFGFGLLLVIGAIALTLRTAQRSA